MTKSTEKLTAREFVWVHRIRQRIAFERIILTVGNPNEKLRAKQFLEASGALFKAIKLPPGKSVNYFVGASS